MRIKEKKSDRFELRLSHNKKQAFLDACDNQGDTPSSALRRFIDSYIRRANVDTFKFSALSLKNAAKRNWLKVGSALTFCTCAVLFGPLILSTYESHKLTQKTTKLYAMYDKNNDGLLSLNEVSENDFQLHRVLDIDKTVGISLDEFRISGRMLWMPGKSKEGKFPPKDWSDRTLVEFNLENPQNIKVNSWVPNKPLRNTAQTVDRLVHWSQVNNRASLIWEEATIYNHKNGKISGKFKHPIFPDGNPID